MALGRAFIEVHADTRPFARELGTELDRILKRVESTTVKQAGTKMGQTLSTSVSNSVQKSGTKIGQGVAKGLNSPPVLSAFQQFTAGIIDTIDDGISGLPVEIKSVLGGALLILAPLAFALGSGLAGAIVAGLTAGLAGLIIVAVGSQFVEVRDAASDLVSDIRDIFLVGASQWIGPILDAIRLVRMEFIRLLPDIQGLFSDAVQLAVPLVEIFVALIEGSLPGLRDAIRAIEPSLDSLRAAALLIGEAFANFFATIAENDDLPAVLYDLGSSVAFLVNVLTFFIDKGIDLYGVLLDLAEVIGLIQQEDAITTFTGAGNAAAQMGNQVRGTIVPLEAQERQLEENNRQLKAYLDYQFDIIGGDIAFEQGLDDLTAALKRNGDTLNITKQEGRDNANVLLELTRNIINTRDQTILMTGDVAGATAKFELQRAKIYEVARQMGLSRAEVDKLIAELLKIPPPVETGVTPQTLARLALAISRVKTLSDLLADLETQAAIAAVVAAAANSASRADEGRGAGQQRAATAPLALPSAPPVLPPLTQTAPIQSGRSGAAPDSRAAVNVYIGNKQIDAYTEEMFHVKYLATAREMAYGYRGF